MTDSIPGSGQMRILKSHQGVLLQDWGRMGFQHIGITRGGPVDEQSFAWANRLLGNLTNTPAIEISMGGLRVEFSAATICSITGRGCDCTHNGVILEQGATHIINAGDQLEFLFSGNRLRTYLAVAGGFRGRNILGSVSMVPTQAVLDPANMGLHPGQCVSYPAAFMKSLSDQRRRIPWQYLACDPTPEPSLDFIPCGSWSTLTDDQQQRFLSAKYKVDSKSNRMGYRLHGEPITGLPSAFFSRGAMRGLIQVPPDGQPIVLLNDHQTIAGYPIIGRLSHRASDQLSQCQPGQNVGFSTITLEEAQRQRLDFLRYFNME